MTPGLFGGLSGGDVHGKTGTAEKSNGRGYSKDKVLASFLAAFPIDSPRYVVLVSFDEPKGDASTHGLRYGGWTAGPVAGRTRDSAFRWATPARKSRPQASPIGSR